MSTERISQDAMIELLDLPWSSLAAKANGET